MAGNPHYEGNPKAVDVFNNKYGKEYKVKPLALNIVWGKDPRYWDLNSDKPAELLQVSWLEVTGSVDVNPRKSCQVVFRVSLTPDAFGWGGAPIYIMAKRGKKGKFLWRKQPLMINSNDSPQPFDIKMISEPDLKNLDDSRLYFGLYEVWSGKWKGGLRIHEVRVRELPDSS